MAEFRDSEENQLVKELKKIVGALNARGLGDDNNPVMVKLAMLETEVKHLQASMRETRNALWGVAAGVLAVVIKMVLEGAVR